MLHTGAAAALRGFKVVVPVDGMSADDVFPELYTAWHLATAARISAQVTLTRMDLVWGIEGEECRPRNMRRARTTGCVP